MNVEDFYKMPKALAKADGYISKTTGEAVKITASGKIIYTFMLYRNKFFVEELKGDHFESQATIASSCGMEYKAVGRILREFRDHGLIAAKKVKPEKGGQFRWFYEYVSKDVILYIGDQKDFKIIDSDKKVVVNSKPNQEQKPIIPDWDESDLPF